MSLLPSRQVLLGMSLGAVCASALAAIGPGMVMDAIADEFIGPEVIAPGFDTSKLVRFEGRDYEIRSEDWVSQDPISSQRVKKVEGGHVSYVTIATTSTGTYSSDGLFSKHVQYPGIEVEDVTWPGGYFYWGAQRWSSYSRKGSSFYYIRSGDTRVFGNASHSCVAGKSYVVC